MHIALMVIAGVLFCIFMWKKVISKMPEVRTALNLDAAKTAEKLAEDIDSIGSGEEKKNNKKINNFNKEEHLS